MAPQRRKNLTADMISAPTNFVHFDGPSFGQQRVTDLEEARCRALFERLQKSVSKNSLFLRHTAATECCFLTSLRLCPLVRRTVSGPLDISAPFDFVHISHASLRDLEHDALPNTSKHSGFAVH